MKRDDPQFKLRLPQEMKDWLQAAAKSKYHSMQAEVLSMIAEAMRKDESKSNA